MGTSTEALPPNFAGREQTEFDRPPLQVGPLGPMQEVIAFLLRSLPVLPEEILERFSSSSLPPSFALGRFAASSFARRLFFSEEAPRLFSEPRRTAASPLAAGDDLGPTVTAARTHEPG